MTERAARRGNGSRTRAHDRTEAPARPATVADTLLRAIESTTVPWAVFEAIRSESGAVADLRVLYANPPYWALSGLDPGQTIGRGLKEIAPDVDWTESLAGMLFEALESGQSLYDRNVHSRSQLGRQAGAERIFETELTVTGDVLAARFRDITREVELAEDRGAALARFEAIFEQMPMAITIVGADRRARLNRAATDLYGRDAEEMARLAFIPNAPWIPDDQRELWAEMRRQTAAGELVSGVRFALLRPNGERREVEGSAIPITTTEGVRVGVVTVLTDLTDGLSLEAQLRHAQKMEALGRLAGGIAHDFNNVLMAILGFAELIAEDARNGRINPNHSEQVLVATERAIELTARLTRFARREVAHKAPVEVSHIVTGLLPLIERLAPESIEVRTHLEPGPVVVLDRSEFEQALINLVVNAVDAMPKGGRLTIETQVVELSAERGSRHPGEDSGRWMLIAVSDTGAGMDQATRARIFEPFYTTKGPGEGTGLGLAMVFAAVERAGGRIWVYSEVDLGTTFKIYLPPAEKIVPTGTGGPIAAERAPGGSESILILEDEPMVRDFVARVLADRGYDVAMAARPSEAFELAATRPFDLLISDIVMPEMTGDAVARRLRVAHPEMPVLFMSGYTARALDFELGPRDALAHKPITSNELSRLVRAALDTP